jgi:hypothetical protein
VKNIMISLGLFAFLVVAYLGYDLLGQKSNPCGQIFEQTTASLTTKIDILEQDTSLMIGRNRIRELSSSAQQMALGLQSCCIAAQTDIITGKEFLQCQTETTTYATRLDAIVARLASLEKSNTTDVTTTIAMAETANTTVNHEKLSELQPNALQPTTTSAPSARMKPTETSKPTHSKKAQLDVLIDQALLSSENFHKKVANVGKK